MYNDDNVTCTTMVHMENVNFAFKINLVRVLFIRIKENFDSNYFY